MDPPDDDDFADSDADEEPKSSEDEEKTNMENERLIDDNTSDSYEDDDDDLEPDEDEEESEPESEDYSVDSDNFDWETNQRDRHPFDQQESTDNLKDYLMTKFLANRDDLRLNMSRLSRFPEGDIERQLSLVEQPSNNDKDSNFGQEATVALFRVTKSRLTECEHSKTSIPELIKHRYKTMMLTDSVPGRFQWVHLPMNNLETVYVSLLGHPGLSQDKLSTINYHQL